MFSHLPASFLSWCASNISDKFLVALCILFFCFFFFFFFLGGGGQVPWVILAKCDTSVSGSLVRCQYEDMLLAVDCF